MTPRVLIGRLCHRCLLIGWTSRELAGYCAECADHTSGQEIRVSTSAMQRESVRAERRHAGQLAELRDTEADPRRRANVPEAHPGAGMT